VERSVPAPDIITGGDLLAIRPTSVGIEVKGDHRAVVIKRPTLGNTGLWLKRDRVFDCKPLEQCPNEVVFRHACDHMWVKTLRLGAIPVMQDAIAVALDDVAFARATSSENATQQKK
jgi:hypothetical protein